MSYSNGLDWMPLRVEGRIVRNEIVIQIKERRKQKAQDVNVLGVEKRSISL